MLIRKNLLRTFGWISLIIFTLLIYSHCLLAQKPNSSKAELDKVKNEYNRTKEDKEELERKWKSADEQEKGVLEKLEELDDELSEKEQELQQYDTDLKSSELRKKELEAELVTLQNNEKEYRANIVKRIRAMYKFGYRGREYSVLRVLLGADSIMNLLNRHKYINAITRVDRDLLGGVQTGKESIKKAQSDINERTTQITELRDETKKRRKEIKDSKGKKKELLKGLREDKEEYNKAILDLEESVEKLETLLVGLGYKPEKPALLKGFSRRDLGNLPMPLSGDMKIIDNLAKGERGITIVAKKGTNIHCIADGEIARLDSVTGYGNLVIVAHGRKYFSVYAHVSEILAKKGERVKKGQVIAKVGDTGSIKGPMLYLELWKDRGKLNTKQWLAIPKEKT